jgi:SulP family sulfate permease
LRNIRQILDVQLLLPALVAGIIGGVLTIIVEISFAALIFGGSLSDHIFDGIGFTMFGAFVIGAYVAITSSDPLTMARPHEIPAAILAIVAASIASVTPSENVFITVIAAIMISSILCGLFFLLLGRLRMGTLIRFIPFPVIGGFLAGTGWLLVKGGLSVATGMPVKISNIATLLSPYIAARWLPSMIFAIVLYVVMQRFRHYMVMPVVIISGIIVFYVIMASTGMSVDEAIRDGWLLKPLSDGAMWHPVEISRLVHVDWQAILSQSGNIATILLISVISMLLNASGFELVARRDVDFNRELQSVGIANIIAAMGGGTVGFHSLSLSALSFTMGVKTRLAGLTAAAVCGAILFFGSSLLVYIPKPVLGAMLLYSGIGFLIEWAVQARKRLPRTDYVLVIGILLVIALFGFLQGVAVGLLVAIAVFVIKYSSISVVKYELSGVNFRSNVDRSTEQQALLAGQGESQFILRLHGFIFFGTANSLLETVRQRADRIDRARVNYVVMDFSLVSGIDSSALRSFTKMIYLAQERGFTMVFCAVGEECVRTFDRGGYRLSDGKTLMSFPDLDHAIEWCENCCISSVTMLDIFHDQPLSHYLAEAFQDTADIARFTGYLEREEEHAGEYVMRQGDACRGLYFVEKGRVTVQLEKAGEPPVRLRTMGAGTIVGEMGLYLGTPASASVIADQSTVMFRLSPDALRKMEQEAPSIATAFHKHIVKLLGERLAYTNRSIAAMAG